MINSLTALIDDQELNFMVDLASMDLKTTTKLYFLADDKTLIQLTLDKNLTLQNTHKIQLPQLDELKRLLIYNSTVFILDYNKVYKINLEPLNSDLHQKVEHIDLKREYSDMAVINGTFAFIRGYSTIVFSDTWNPESALSTISSTRFHHGKFLPAGFNHFILMASETDVGEQKYFAFTRETTTKSILVTPLRGKPTAGSFVVQFKHVVYHITPKTMAVEYLGSSAELITMDKPIHGQLHGIVGHYDRTEESLHPVASVRLRLKKKLRFRKHFLNCLHSELVCTNLKGQAVARRFEARILTRKTQQDLALSFEPAKPQSAFVIPDMRARGMLTSMPNHTAPVAPYRRTDPPHKNESPTGANNTKGETEQKDGEKRAVREWLHYAVLICLLIVMAVLCLMRLTLKRDLRGMEAADQIIGASPTRDPAGLATELGEVSAEHDYRPRDESRRPPEAEVSLNQTDADVTYRHDPAPVDDSLAEVDDPPMPDMTL